MHEQKWMHIALWNLLQCEASSQAEGCRLVALFNYIFNFSYNTRLNDADTLWRAQSDIRNVPDEEVKPI